jgi:hypothetical protein
MFVREGRAAFRQPQGSGDERRTWWPVKPKGWIGWWPAAVPTAENSAVRGGQGCRRSHKPECNVGVVLVLVPVTRLFRFVYIVVVRMGMELPRRDHEVGRNRFGKRIMPEVAE